MSVKNVKNVTVKQIQQLDKIAIEKIGVPSLSLMENAGRSVSEVVIKCLKEPQKSTVSIFCGLGNNAGDGFVVARHLMNAGVSVKTYLIGRSLKLKNDALVNYRILKKSGYNINEIKKTTQAVKKQIFKSDIIVDAIFGVGLSREVKSPFREIIENLNKSKRRIIAVDIPSGLDGTSGKIYGICIKAWRTVTFSFPKTGLFKKSGPLMTGKVIVADIGIPDTLMRKRF